MSPRLDRSTNPIATRGRWGVLAVAAGFALAACGGDDGGAAVAPPAVEDTGDDAEPQDDAELQDDADTTPPTDAGGGSSDDAGPLVETRDVGLTVHLEGFVVEVESATFEQRRTFDGDPLPTDVVVDTVVENLVDQNQRGPSYASLRAGDAVFESLLQPVFIDALGIGEVQYRFEIDAGLGPDDVVLWFEHRDRGTPAAVPLGDAGPVHTLEPIDVSYTTPDPVGDVTFEGATGQVVFYDGQARPIRGYAYLDLDLTATNTGDATAGVERFEIEVDGVGVTPSGDRLRAGSLRLDPGETTDQAVRRFQFPIYGARITISASVGINDDPIVFLEVDVPELADAIPEEARPEPPS